MPRESTGKNWACVWNNYPDDYRDQLTRIFTAFNDDESHPNEVCYYLSGEERGEQNNTPHLQGYVNFRYPISFSKLRILWPAHFEITRYVKNYINYCKKGLQPKEEWDRVNTRGPNFGRNAVLWEWGALPEGQGKRSDLKEFREHVRQTFENGGWVEKEDVRDDFPDIAAKYWNFCLQTIDDLKPYRQVEAHPLRPWQQELNHTLNLPANDRSIHFVIDTTGRSGKSWFAKYYRQTHEKYSVQIIHPGKNGDIKMTLRESARVFFVDIPRWQSEHFPWGVLEKIKDGEDQSGKYQPFRISMRHDNIHIVVLTNKEPDHEIFSEDRWNVIRL